MSQKRKKRFRSGTAYSWFEGEGGYLNAFKHNYIVIPKPKAYPEFADLKGCVAVVVDAVTGNYVYCIVGDFGPSDSVGEVSYAVAVNLGHDYVSGSMDAEGRFYFYILPGTNPAGKWNRSTLNDDLAKVGSKYYP